MRNTIFLASVAGNFAKRLEDISKFEKAGFMVERVECIVRRVNESMIYIGSSAGAVVASPNIQLERYFDERPQPVQMTSKICHYLA